MRARIVRIAVSSFAVAALALGSAGTAQAVVAATIRGSGTTWNPTHVTINAGQTVKWKATSGSHTIHSYGGNWSFSRSLASGTSRTHTFNNTGTFKFYCTIHGSVSGGVCSGMCGKVRVT
jgi:plastocyanin